MRRLTPRPSFCSQPPHRSQSHAARAAEAPSPAQALALTPIQPNVEYAIPTKEEAAQCTIRPEKENNITSWVVRNHDGEILRRFADTNGDNVVDEWCYFQNGLEVYRDIDSNFNGKADQYRWFNTAGTRWGIDKNEDGKIDSWKVISPHEVAEQVVLAIKNRDPARFELLLLTPTELTGLGFGKARQDSICRIDQKRPGRVLETHLPIKRSSRRKRAMSTSAARVRAPFRRARMARRKMSPSRQRSRAHANR